MKKLNAFAILTLLTALTFSSAQAQHQRRDGRSHSVQSFVGKRVLPHQVLHVKTELSLRDYQGQEVESVSVEAMTRTRTVTATLYINGRAVSRPQMIRPARSQRAPRVSRITFPLRRAFVIGRDTKTIQVKFDSVVFVDGISAILKRSAPSRPPRARRVSKDIYKFRAGFGEKMNLAAEMGIGPQRAERRVEKVKLTVRTLVAKAQIELCRPN